MQLLTEARCAEKTAVWSVSEEQKRTGIAEAEVQRLQLSLRDTKREHAAVEEALTEVGNLHCGCQVAYVT